MLCNKVVSLNLSVVRKDTEKEIKSYVIAENLCIFNKRTVLLNQQ